MSIGDSSLWLAKRQETEYLAGIVSPKVAIAWLQNEITDYNAWCCRQSVDPSKDQVMFIWNLCGTEQVYQLRRDLQAWKPCALVYRAGGIKTQRRAGLRHKNESSNKVAKVIHHASNFEDSRVLEVWNWKKISLDSQVQLTLLPTEANIDL